jgi:hypothetical protein
MKSNKNEGGWQKVDIRDSFIMCPINSLPESTKNEALNKIGSYNLIFGEMMFQSRPETPHVLLPDYQAKQPLHIFCPVATNFDSNKLTLLQAIEEDREMAALELDKLRMDSAKEEELKDFIGKLSFIEKVAKDGKETELASDVVELVPEELKDGNEVASEKGVKYFSYSYNGFRPVL